MQYKEGISSLFVSLLFRVYNVEYIFNGLSSLASHDNCFNYTAWSVLPCDCHSLDVWHLRGVRLQEILLKYKIYPAFSIAKDPVTHGSGFVLYDKLFLKIYLDIW